MQGLLADSKHALRLYLRTPLASLIAVGVLAVGLAFVGSFVSLYVDLILRPYPGFENSTRIVSIGLSSGTIRVSLLERMIEEVSSLDVIAGVSEHTLELGPEREARYVELVTQDYFDGVRPRLALGRGFDATDHAADAAPVTVISDDYWRERFDRSPDVLGRVVEIAPRSPTAPSRVVDGRPEIMQQDETDGEPTAFRIVGVMAPVMPGLWRSDIALWLPLDRAAQHIYPPEQLEAGRRSRSVSVVGRRARGVSAAAIARELQARYADFDEYYLQPGFRFEAVDGIVRNFDVHRDVQRQLRLFLVGSILLALVAAANVSLFLLARAPGRRRELGIRMSIGAPMQRLARQLATESALLVLVAAALGLMMSIWLGNFLRGLSFLRRAEWGDVTMLDWRVLGLLGAFLMLLTLAVSLAPILGLKRLGVAASSRQLVASATLAQRVAGTVQIAIAGTLGAAGLAVTWYLGTLMLGSPGYATDDLYIADFTRNFGSGAQGFFVGNFLLSVAEQERLRDRLESLPSVEAVAFGGPVPGSGSGRGSRTVSDPRDPTREISFITGAVDSRFIEMLGFRLLYGRAPIDSESGVAVVNLTGAREYFGRDNVVGEYLPIADRGGTQTSSEIVGVVEDLSFWHPADEVEPLVFLTEGARGTVLRSSRPVAELQRDMQGLIDSGVLEVVSVSLTPVAALRSAFLAPDRARGFLTIVTASLVVLLAAFGFYGTQRYLVGAGRREYAIRASLGAGPAALGRLVLGRGVALSLPGLILGGLLAFIAVASMRDDFGSRDISAGVVAAAVVVGLGALLIIASLGPAREAKCTQPALLLRED
jgi:putative ABC transport system permease protein